MPNNECKGKRIVSRPVFRPENCAPSFSAAFFIHEHAEMNVSIHNSLHPRSRRPCLTAVKCIPFHINPHRCCPAREELISLLLPPSEISAHCLEVGANSLKPEKPGALEIWKCPYHEKGLNV